MREIVMDTETTGLDPETGDRIVEIGAVELLNHLPTGRVLQLYINPERDMPIEAERVHGLSAAFLRDKPKFAEVAREFIDFIEGATLVIHNAAFDIGFLNAEFARIGAPAITMDRVDKFYKVEGQRRYILRQQTIHFQSGYSYGLLGVNGAGKSTTIRLLAGLELPDVGTIRRNVRVSWPLGFASGFNLMMSGRENLKFVSRAYGEDPKRVMEFVADFSELGAYLYQPVKTYSSGMVARLAFGLSMAIEFDCYLIDEIVSVGDARFQKRCEEVFQKRRERASLIMVTHDMQMVNRFCDRALVLVDGELRPFANVDDAISAYMRLNK